MEFRKAIGNRIYGCDDCLSACPWNKFAQQTHEMKLKAREDLIAPPLVQLLALNDEAFRQFFTASPVKRIGRNRFVRNCLIAAGNSGDTALIEPVKRLLDDNDPYVAGMAVWALKQLLDDNHFNQLRQHYMTIHKDPLIMTEWTDTSCVS